MWHLVLKLRYPGLSVQKPTLVRNWAVRHRCYPSLFSEHRQATSWTQIASQTEGWVEMVRIGQKRCGPVLCNAACTRALSWQTWKLGGGGLKAEDLMPKIRFASIEHTRAHCGLSERSERLCDRCWDSLSACQPKYRTGRWATDCILDPSSFLGPWRQRIRESNHFLLSTKKRYIIMKMEVL